jgi:hypothetical protein
MQLEKYKTINNSFNKRIVFHFGEKAGFYSEFNNMILGMVYCLTHQIRFKIYSADANFRFQNGWNDYFIPFCDETRNKIHHFTNKRAHHKKRGRQKFYAAFNRLFNKNLLITSDLWYEFRKIDKNFNLNDYKILFPDAKNLQDICRDMIDMVYHFNEETQQLIDEVSKNISFQGDYIGFHIRGGDKFLEHQLIETNEYIKRAESISDVRQGYVFTDDYSLFELMCKEYPNWSFQTLAPKNDSGYFHKEFIKLPAEIRKMKTIQMFASIELLSNAQHSFCTFSSNVGMYLGMKMGEKAHGIDFDNWLIW